MKIPQQQKQKQVMKKQKTVLQLLSPVKSWAKKDRYTISFVLPFSTDEGELLKLMGEDKINRLPAFSFTRIL
jgi:hypothetical protein